MKENIEQTEEQKQIQELKEIGDIDSLKELSELSEGQPGMESLHNDVEMALQDLIKESVNSLDKSGEMAAEIPDYQKNEMIKQGGSPEDIADQLSEIEAEKDLIIERGVSSMNDLLPDGDKDSIEKPGDITQRFAEAQAEVSVEQARLKSIQDKLNQKHYELADRESNGVVAEDDPLRKEIDDINNERIEAARSAYSLDSRLKEPLVREAFEGDKDVLEEVSNIKAEIDKLNQEAENIVNDPHIQELYKRDLQKILQRRLDIVNKYYGKSDELRASDFRNGLSDIVTIDRVSGSSERFSQEDNIALREIGRQYYSHPTNIDLRNRQKQVDDLHNQRNAMKEDFLLKTSAELAKKYDEESNSVSRTMFYNHLRDKIEKKI